MRTEDQIRIELTFELEALKAARQSADYHTLHGHERYLEVGYRCEKLEFELHQLVEQNERALLAQLVVHAQTLYSLCQERGLTRRQAVSLFEGVMV